MTEKKTVKEGAGGTASMTSGSLGSFSGPAIGMRPAQQRDANDEDEDTEDDDTDKMVGESTVILKVLDTYKHR